MLDSKNGYLCPNENHWYDAEKAPGEKHGYKNILNNHVRA
jgi:hypothetical protein